MNILLLSGLVLGLGASFHCLGMCGPLALSVPFHHLEKRKQWLAITSYYLAKALGYGVMGIAFGLIGNSFQWMNWQQGLSILSGSVLLLITFIPVIKNKLSSNFLFDKQVSALYSKLIKQKSIYNFISLGFLNAFLPCGMVYTALAAATVTGSALQGFIFMFLFGIGTSPALITLISFKNKMSLKKRMYFRKSSYYLSILIGICLIIRGLNLGIPYLSPSYSPAEKEVNCCHK